MPHYNDLSKELQERILDDRKNHRDNPYAFSNEDATELLITWLIPHQQISPDIANKTAISTCFFFVPCLSSI